MFWGNLPSRRPDLPQRITPMPRQYHMSWEGAPRFRWVKMYKGFRYRVTCAELGARAMVWTKEGTGKLANAWWEKKVREVEGDPARLEKVVQIFAGDDDLSRRAREAVDTRDDRDRSLQELLRQVAEPSV